MFKEIEVIRHVVDVADENAKPVGFNIFGDRNDARAFAEDVITKNQDQKIRCFIREYKAMEVVFESTKDHQVSDAGPSSVQ